MFASSGEVFRQESHSDLTHLPVFRRLRGYALDPSLSLRLDTVAINHAIFEVPWEIGLRPGPRGEYLEVLDFDPASAAWYEPVDLNNVNLLAQDGLPPSEGNPQFHQQMVYAVAMRTIANFEAALGRQVLWSPRVDENGAPGRRETFVRALRIYPHALRAANAYYSPQKKALLFGYFQGPTGTIFSCLSHDIVAHETTHALLDGMHRRYVEDNHPDTLAFHEAFADLVALFQHFTFPEVLKHQIAKTRGDLESQSLLGELAQQFGQATGRYGALRNAIGEWGDDGKWAPITPDPSRLARETEPHARGSILVAAMFAAFLAIYRIRCRSVVSLATAGSGVLPEGALHPSLVDALAQEATKAAKHFLGMCIRALDYCPPFDITFGDYLRALVTADFDLVPNDKLGYRVALIEAFRRWGILPDGLRTLSEEQLRLPFARVEFSGGDGNDWDVLASLATELRGLVSDSLYTQDRGAIFESLRGARARAHDFLHDVFKGQPNEHRNAYKVVTGLNLDANAGLDGLRMKSSGLPSFEVHAVVPSLRVSPDGRIVKQLLVSVTQRRRGVPIDESDTSKGVFDFRGGSTLIFNMDSAQPTLRYAITRPIDDVVRRTAIQRYKERRLAEGQSLRATYFSTDDAANVGVEPFCLLHGEH